MKVFIKLMYCCCIAAIFSSCRSALSITPVTKMENFYGEENMEFIGFKNVEKNHYLLKDFGKELERSHIALNRQDFYMGVYSLQELEVYKASKRYVTFVDVLKLSSTYNDNVLNKPNLEITAYVIAGLTCFAGFPIYVPMLIASKPNKCKLSLQAEFKLYVYDTQKKEIVLSIPMSIDNSNIYKGSYLHKDTDRSAITQRDKTLLNNLLLENYSKAYNFITNINE